MLPLILVAVGAYLIGDSVLGDSKKYAKGGIMAKGGEMAQVNKMSKDELKNWLSENYGFRGVDGKGITKDLKDRTIENMRKEVLSQMKYNEKNNIKYAKGGMSQGYDDKEDERLGMKDGKMSSKDLDSTHARRDDARFEERGKMEHGGMMAKGGDVNDFYDNLQVHVQGVGTIYHGQSMKSAIKKADAYLLKNPKAEVVIVDEKYGDEYDLEGNQIENEDEYAKGGDLGKKLYYTMNNVGKAKYTVSKHDGESTHKDGSAFYDIKLFKNKVAYQKYLKQLQKEGYKERGFNYAEGGKLVGKQKNLDVNKNGKLDAEDFKMLRKDK